LKTLREISCDVSKEKITIGMLYTTQLPVRSKLTKLSLSDLRRVKALYIADLRMRNVT